jgi:hypothetical protein
MKDFNYKLSKQRISVEHAFGCLKLRFRSLQLMGSHDNVDDVWRAIDAMLIFHNLCLRLDDHPRYLPGYTETAGTMEEDLNAAVDNAVGGPVNIPLVETDARLREDGYALRDQLLDTVCPLENYE